MELPLQHYLEDLHARLSTMTDGAVASYIPELALANPDHFGICIVATDGYAYAVGDSDVPFTIQSISKAFVYATALADRGRPAVLAKVGVEPSGDAFNSISLDPKTGAPVNPMINAGAIATTGMVAGEDASAQWERIHTSLSAFAGRALSVDETVYQSESDTGFRNRAIAWMLRNFDISEGDPMPSLENYFRQCSLEVSCRDLAFMAATLANGGMHPHTGERVASPEEVEALLSVMATCGMYDYAGSWLFEVGMPAKSGVGGGIIAVLPGRFGIAVFSPRLDEIGNSVRGIEVCKQISRDFGLHVFGPGQSSSMVLNRVYSGADVPARRGRSSTQRAVLETHIGRIRYLELQGDVAVDGADFVGRRIADLTAEADIFILDFHRVTALRPSAASVLAKVGDALRAQGGLLLMSRLRGRKALEADLAEHCAGIPRFDDNEIAMEWCEEQVLEKAGLSPATAATVDATAFSLFSGLDAGSLLRLGGILRELKAAPGDVLIRAGEQSNDRVFLILRGDATVRLPLFEGGEQRVAKLSAGAVFGETALLGMPARTASVRAETELACLCFAAADFDRLTADYPQIKIAVLNNLATELASKLSQSNQLIRALAG
jgi:glutaminase